jgi:NAD(P)-dependent dehydrogenase (short-subunit alcohol dehydrogenase family)
MRLPGRGRQQVEAQEVDAQGSATGSGWHADVDFRAQLQGQPIDLPMDLGEWREGARAMASDTMTAARRGLRRAASATRERVPSGLRRRRRSRWQQLRWPALAAGAGALWLAREAAVRAMEVDLRDRTVLITGGSRGLGLLLAREFGAQGCRVVICARDEAELERARLDLEARGVRTLAVQCDVSRREDVARLAREATERFGGVDVLVNNAGVMQVGPIESMTPDDFEQAMGVMFWGAVYPTLEVLPGMWQREFGRVVNITSLGGRMAVPHLVPYVAAKFAATGFSESLRAELADTPVRVTTVTPGLMRTGSHVNAKFKGRQQEEARWFSLLASLPGLSMDAERAARRIVRAARRGEADLVLTVPAHLATRFHGLAPGLTARISGVVDRMLPSADGRADGAVRGMEALDREGRLYRTATALGRSAAERFNQYPGPVTVPVTPPAAAERPGAGTRGATASG